MNPGVSLAITVVLPQSLISWRADWVTSVSVAIPGIISTMGITGAGLKKWHPKKRPGFLSADEREATDREEVLVARMQSRAAIPSSRRKASFLTSSSSMTASKTMLHWSN